MPSLTHRWMLYLCLKPACAAVCYLRPVPAFTTGSNVFIARVKGLSVPVHCWSRLSGNLRSPPALSFWSFRRILESCTASSVESPNPRSRPIKVHADSPPWSPPTWCLHLLQQLRPVRTLKLPWLPIPWRLLNQQNHFRFPLSDPQTMMSDPVLLPT